MDKAEEFSRKLRALEIMDMLFPDRSYPDGAKWYRGSIDSPFKEISDEKVLCWVPPYQGLRFPYNADIDMCGKGYVSWFKNSNFVWMPRRDVEYFNSMCMQTVVAACIYTKNEDGEPLFLMLKLPQTSKYVQSYHPGTLTFPQGHVTMSDCNDFSHIGDPEVLRDTMISALQRELNEELYAQHVGGFQQTVINLKMAINNLDMQYTNGKAWQEHFVYLDNIGTAKKHHWFCFEIPVESIYDNMDNVAIMSGEPDKHSVVWLTLPQIYDEWLKGNVCPYTMKVFQNLQTVHYDTSDMDRVYESVMKIL